MSAPTQRTTADEFGHEPRSERRVKLERMWIVGVVLFTIGRGLVVWGTIGTDHVNVWVFAFIDLATAVPYGLSTARVVEAVVDRRGAAMFRWIMVAAGSFIAPYLYIAFASKKLPSAVYIVLAILIVAMGGNAILGIRKKVARIKDEQQDEQ